MACLKLSELLLKIYNTNMFLSCEITKENHLKHTYKKRHTYNTVLSLLNRLKFINTFYSYKLESFHVNFSYVKIFKLTFDFTQNKHRQERLCLCRVLHTKLELSKWKLQSESGSLKLSIRNRWNEFLRNQNHLLSWIPAINQFSLWANTSKAA